VNQNPNTLIADPVNKVADTLDALKTVKSDNDLYTAMQNAQLAVRTLGEAANATPAEQAAISTFTLKWAEVSTAYDQYQQATATAHRSDTRASDAQRAIDDAIAKLIGS
jgi:hypothetical protein